MAALGATTAIIHGLDTQVYESGVEGEIWRFIGSLGKSYQDGCVARNLTPDVDCIATDDELYGPIGFDIYDDHTVGNYRLYVADRNNFRVVVYDYFGNWTGITIKNFIGANGAADQFADWSPEGVTVDAAGNVFVTDTANERVVAFKKNPGVSIATETYDYEYEIKMLPGVQTAQLAIAKGTSVTKSLDNCATQGPARLALTTWGYDGDTTDKNQVLLFDEHFCRVGQVGLANTSWDPVTPGKFFLPTGTSIGPSGEIYVAGYSENKIEVFWPDSTSPSGYTRRIGINTDPLLAESKVTDSLGRVVALDGPYGVMVDARGRLVVGDTNNNRIAVFLQPWHSENTSPRVDPNDPNSIGTLWQFAFELTAQGAISGSWLGQVREDTFGRWLGSSVVRDLIYAFEIPQLAIANAAAGEVATAGGDVLRVRGDILVPVGKVALDNVVPGVTVDASVPPTGRATLGAPSGPFLAAAGADVFDPLYEGTAITDIASVPAGQYARVYWDFPIQSDGEALFWLSASKTTGSGTIQAEPKSASALTIAGTCTAPTLNPLGFDKTGYSTTDATTQVLTTVYGNNVTVTVSATQASEGVKQLEVKYLEGEKNGTTEVYAASSASLLFQLGYQGSSFQTIRYRAVANCGAPSAWQDYRFKIDAKAPRLDFGPVRPAAAGTDADGRNWYTAADVEMDVTADDDDTFSSNVEFLQPAEYVGASGGQITLHFTAEGKNQNRFVKVQDPVGNAFGEFSNVKGLWIHIDRTAPSLTLTPTRGPDQPDTGWYRSDVTVRAIAEDASYLSGVKTLTSPDGLTITDTPVACPSDGVGTRTTACYINGLITVAGEGAGLTVSATTSDYAGNAASKTSASINIDRTSPVATIAPNPPAASYQNSVSVNLSAIDPAPPANPGATVSGIARIVYSVNGGTPTDYTGAFTIARRGVSVVTFWAEDNAGNTSVPQSVSYDVHAAPATQDSAYETREDNPVEVKALASDPLGDALTYTVTTPPQHGAVTGFDSTTGKGLYTPAANYVGGDSFVVTASVGSDSATARITLTMTPENDWPTAVNDTAATSEDTAATIAAATLVANDIDVDGDTLTVSAVGSPVNGDVELTPGGIVFTPAPNFNGTGSFTYTVKDAVGERSTATVTVAVAAVNDPPNAVDDTANTAEDTPATIAPATLLANDTDPETDTLTIVAVGGATNGTVQLSGGSVLFTPASNFSGTATFTYTAQDPSGATDSATVSVTVASVNDAPTAANDTANATEDTASTIALASLLANDTDPESDTLTAIAVGNPVNGSVAIVGSDAVFTPAPNFNGTASFTYTIQDPAGLTSSATVTVTVTAVNDAPTAVNDTVGTNEDSSATIAFATLTANDTDPDGDTLGVISVADAVNGSVQISGGSVVFTPAANFAGAASFTYTIKDAGNLTSTATVTVNVAAVNDPPTAVNDSAATAEDTALTLTASALTGNDSDPDNDALSINAVGGAVNGTVLLLGSGSVQFTPGPNFNGTASFTYTIKDAAGASSTATVTVSVSAVNDAPVANDAAVSTIETAPVSISPSYSDIDGDTLTMTLNSNPLHGTVSLAGGVFTYTAAAGFIGPDSFTYKVSDGTASTIATIYVTVKASNQNPSCDNAVVSPSFLWAPNHQPQVITINGVTDPDGDTLTIVFDRILQDEPTQTIGDGNTPVDAGGIGTSSAWVRAERMGPESDRTYNNGRLYEIFFTASDGKGGACSKMLTVGVVHDQRVGAAVVDNGCRWDSANGTFLECRPGAVLPRSNR